MRSTKITLTQSRYDRIAPLYDRLEARLERTTYARWREQLWTAVHGPQLLEIGAGTGKNFRYYPRGVGAAAIDFSSRMVERARMRIGEAACSVALSVMDVQRLAFPDASFDTVVGTFVFGSVSDPIEGLREVRRVTKPGGRLLLLEYVRPPGIAGLLVDLLNPAARVVYGANINRRTSENVRQSGWEIESVQEYWRGLVQVIIARSARNEA